VRADDGGQQESIVIEGRLSLDRRDAGPVSEADAVAWSCRGRADSHERLNPGIEDRTRLLLAQLQDAREAEAAAAALAERGRITGELHDLLAHSLSGLAIQLQGVRKLAGREAVSEALRAAIDRSAELAKAGLTDARQAVSALRGEQLPASAQLDALVKDRPRPSGTPAGTAWRPRFSDTAPPAAGEFF
jgi:signal transduction histidine kinase